MARDVFGIIDEITEGLTDLRRRLEPLASLGGEQRRTARQITRPHKKGALGRGPRTPARTRRRPVSAAVRASRKLQGQYLAAVRRLTKAQRLQVKRVLEKDGKQAAIKAAKGMQKPT